MKSNSMLIALFVVAFLTTPSFAQGNKQLTKHGVTSSTSFGADLDYNGGLGSIPSYESDSVIFAEGGMGLSHGGGAYSYSGSSMSSGPLYHVGGELPSYIKGGLDHVKSATKIVSSSNKIAASSPNFVGSNSNLNLDRNLSPNYAFRPSYNGDGSNPGLGGLTNFGSSTPAPVHTVGGSTDYAKSSFNQGRNSLPNFGEHLSRVKNHFNQLRVGSSTNNGQSRFPSFDWGNLNQGRDDSPSPSYVTSSSNHGTGNAPRFTGGALNPDRKVLNQGRRELNKIRGGSPNYVATSSNQEVRDSPGSELNNERDVLRNNIYSSQSIGALSVLDETRQSAGVSPVGSLNYGARGVGSNTEDANIIYGKGVAPTFHGDDFRQSTTGASFSYNT